MNGSPSTKPPPERASDWAEPNGTPILDAARVPLKAFRENKPTFSAYAMYIWLHLLRPLVLVMFWVGAAFYAWRHFFEPTDDGEGLSLLAIYAVVIAVIFVVMLVVAPVRRRQHEKKRRAKASESSVDALAEFARLPPQKLSRWQRGRRLVVQHDADGQLRNASDLDADLAHAPVPEAPRRTRNRN
ncbi:MAG: poly-beta-1,6-N-acetyl-D-glucosamine biosynthesis protein PgaD [Pseudomonadota bacterium]